MRPHRHRRLDRDHRAGICVATDSADAAAIVMLDVLLDDDGELVTLVVGEAADPSGTERIAAHLASAHPDVELEVHEGGQPLYPYLVGVE